MQQDPNFRGGGTDEEWREQRNGDDPFFGLEQWTRVGSRAGNNTPAGTPDNRGNVPPAYQMRQETAPNAGRPAPEGKSGIKHLFNHRRGENARPDGGYFRTPEGKNAPGGSRGTDPRNAPAPPNGAWGNQPHQNPQQPQNGAWGNQPYQNPPQPNGAWGNQPYQNPQQQQGGAWGNQPYQNPQQPQNGARGNQPYQNPPPSNGLRQGQNASGPAGNPPPGPYAARPSSDGRGAQGPYTPDWGKKPEGEERADGEGKGEAVRTPAPPSGPRAVPSTGVRGRGGTRRGVYVLIAFLAVAAAIVAVYVMLNDSGKQYAYVRRSTLSTSYTGDALIVRNETVYTQEGVSRIEYIAEEGAAVERAENVCVVYNTGFSDKELTTLENYRGKIKDYHKTLLANSTTKDVQLDRLEANVLSLGQEIQSMIQEGRGSLVGQESLLVAAMQARQLYLKQKYPDDQKLARLYDDENTQLQRISSWTRQYAANAQGIVSFYTDGYENVLNLNNYGTYSPTEVRSMFNGNIPPDPGVTRNTVAVYRLVRQGSWVVLLLCRNRDWVPIEGNTYKLLIEGFDTTIVDATLESFTRSGGELLLRLSVAGDINVGNILYVRTCAVMIGESVDSLTVPSKALYTKQGRVGVVIATESGEYWTAVTVVADDGTMAHVIPENPGVLYEGIPVLLF